MCIRDSSNSMPQAKMEHYKAGTLDSVKQHLMMKTQPWDTTAIFEHRNAMCEVLLGSLEKGTRSEDTQRE